MAKATNLMNQRGHNERSSLPKNKFRSLRHSNFVFYQNLKDNNLELYNTVNETFNGIVLNENGEPSGNLADFSTTARFSGERVADRLRKVADAERSKELALLKQHYWDSEFNIDDIVTTGDLVKFINILMDGENRFEYTIARILKGNTAKIGMGEFMVTGVGGNYNTETITSLLKNGKKKVNGYLAKRLNEDLNSLMVEGVKFAIQQAIGTNISTIDDWAKALEQITSFNNTFLDDALAYIQKNYQYVVDNAVLDALDEYFDATIFKGKKTDENKQLLTDLKKWIDEVRLGNGTGIGGELLEGLKKIYGLTGPVYDDIVSLLTEAVSDSGSGTDLKNILKQNIQAKLNIREVIRSEAKNKGLAQEEFKKFCFQAAQASAKEMVKKLDGKEVSSKEIQAKFKTMAKSTGGNEYNLSKADNFFVFGLDSPVITNAIDTSFEEVFEQKKGKSGLAGKMGGRRGINTLAWKKVQTHWNALKKSGFVVYSSVKLTSTAKWKNFEGFNSENIALSNLSDAFRGAGMKQKSDILISAIENSMKGAIYEGNEQSIMNGIAQHFAYFLFDDFTTIGETVETKKGYGINSIHLMDLNGTYVPLSIMLYKLADAVSKESDEDIKKILTANIDYHGAASIKYPDGPWDYEQWLDQRNTALTEITVQIKIMKNFVKYIEDWMKEVTF